MSDPIVMNFDHVINCDSSRRSWGIQKLNGFRGGESEREKVFINLIFMEL